MLACTKVDEEYIEWVDDEFNYFRFAVRSCMRSTRLTTRAQSL